MDNLSKMIGKPLVGVATLSGDAEVIGEFCLQGEDTYLNLHNAPHAYLHFDERKVVPVRLTDGTCVTFLDSIVTEAKNFSSDSSTLCLHPSYAIIGQRTIPADHEFDAVSFTTDDIERIFYDFDAFSIMLNANNELKQIIAKQGEEVGRKIEVGEHPIGAYFTGKFEIVSTDTVFGKVSARHRPRFGMGTPGGIAIGNKIRLQLEFAKPKGARKAIGEVSRLLRFLQIIAGRSQNVAQIEVRTDGDDRQWMDMLWVMAERREHEGRTPHAADLPLNGGVQPTEFAKVMAGWLDADIAKLDARLRFAGCFAHQNVFNIERLVSAANMFDILPSNCFAKPQPLAPDVAEARAQSRKLFKALPPSDVRDRALGDLGRLDQLNLKAKVLQRAEKLLGAAPGKYPHLETVLRQAVDSRNHYVHGSTIKPEKLQFYYDELSFHVEVLEFVFATTDLMESGWDYKKWAAQCLSVSHPFGDFRRNYDLHIKEYVDRLASLK